MIDRRKKSRIALHVAASMILLPIVVVLGRVGYLVYEKDPGLFFFVALCFTYAGVVSACMSYYEKHKYD